MNISDKNSKIIDSCRFCWMCRHICPIGNATGQERNTARSRALVLSLINRGAVGLTEDIMKNMYECACCGACTNLCATGWDPVSFIKEIRLKAAFEGKTPDYIKKMVENTLNTGNPYGKMKMDVQLEQAIKRHEKKEDILFFLGCDTRYLVPDAGMNAIKLLEMSGVRFTVLYDEPSSGNALNFMIGAAGETKKQMENAAGVLNQYQEVIVYDPDDAKVFCREYKEWQVGLDTQIITFTSCLNENRKQGRIKLKKQKISVTYQDPFALSRDLEETKEAREIIESCADLKEMLLNRKDTIWAGNLLMKEYMPDIINKVAEDRIMNAKAEGVDRIITASVSEYAVLKNAAKDIQVQTIEELILESMMPEEKKC